MDVATNNTFSGGVVGTTNFTENFDGITIGGSYASTDFSANARTWSRSNVLKESASNSRGGSGAAVRINDDTAGAHVTAPSVDGVGYITFWYRELSSGGGTLAVQKSVGGGAYSNVNTVVYSGTTFTEYSNTINDASSDIRIRVLNDNHPGHLIVDDFQIASLSGGSVFVPGFEELDVGTEISQLVTGLTSGVDYFYRVTATNSFCSEVSGVITTTTTVASAPEMDVWGTNFVSIADGETVVSTTNGTDFGQVLITGGTLDHVFSITNSGSADLALTGVTTTGVHAADFIITVDPGTNVVAGAITNFTVRFDPTVVGVHTAQISIANNDSNENPYNFTVVGEGIDNQELIVFQGFEGGTNDTWNYTFSPGVSASAVNDDTNRAGTYALTLSGSTNGVANPSIEFDNIDVSDYSSIVIEVPYAADGVDTGDDLDLEVSYDGGATYTGFGTTTLVAGASNGDVAFDQTSVSTPATVTNNPYTVAVPGGTDELRIRITFNEASADNSFDRYWIDSVKVTGGGSVPRIGFDEVVYATEEDAGSIVIPVTISSAIDATVTVHQAGSATGGGTDYSLSATNIVFAAGGSTTSNLTVTLADDVLIEGQESIALTLFSAGGAVVGALAKAAVLIDDDDSISIIAANLVSGTNMVAGVVANDESAGRMLRRLRPDVVAIQEWVITNASYRAFVDNNFGTNFSFYVEPEADGFPIPNGVISRFPITATNEWTDNFVGSRDHVHVTLDIPGPRDLQVVSVHFKAGPTNAALRESQARELTNYITTASFPTNDYLVIAGDLNATSRNENAVNVLTNSFVTDGRQPEDKDGDTDTNLSHARPYDYVLPSYNLDLTHQTVEFEGVTFANGMVFDSRQFNDHLLPMLSADSAPPTNRTHHVVVKLFTVSTNPIPPTVSTRSVSNIMVTAADGGGSVVTNGGAAVTARGVCISTSPSPQTNDTCTSNGSGDGDFNSALTSLSPGQVYYAAAYAENSAGVGYGEDVVFTASCFSAVTALSSTNVTTNTFYANWTAESDAEGYVLDVSISSSFQADGDGTLLDVGFEVTDDGYTPSSTEGSGDTDLFNRTSTAKNNNEGFYWAIEDTTLSDPSIVLDTINIVGVTNFDFSVDLLTPDTEKWDSTDSFIVTYSVDGGATQNLFAVEHDPDDAFNEPARVDSDFDGAGDGDYLPAVTDSHGAGVGTNFTSFSTNDIPVSGTNLVVTLSYFNLDGAGEGLFIDNVVVSNSAGGGLFYVPGYDSRNLGTLVTELVTGLVENTTYYFRVTATNANCSEVSGVITTKTVFAGINAASDIITAGGEVDNIDYALYQEAADLTVGNSLAVWTMTVQDGGGTSDDDPHNTLLTNLVLNITTNDTFLRRAALYNGTVELSEVAVSGTNLNFSGISFVAPDNGDSNLTVRVSFTTTVIDNEQFQFQVGLAEASATSSTFAASNGGGPISSLAGDSNRIEVNATNLMFTLVPAIVGTASNFTVTVQAQDDNGVQDLDKTDGVTITKASGSGTLTGGASQNMVAGEISFTTLQIDTAGIFTLDATATGFATDNSGNITAVEMSITNAVDTNLVWVTSGDANWFYQTNTTFDGVDAAQSGAILDNQDSILTGVLTGPASVEFVWKVDSESGADFLSFSIDNTTNASISGDSGWIETNFALASGIHTGRWIYSKNGSASNGADAAYLDVVTLALTDDLFGPILTNFGVNTAGNLAISDAAFSSFTILVDISDSTSGVKWTSSGPEFTLTNASGAEAQATAPFTTTGHSDGELTTVATATVSGVTFDLGVWTLNMVAEDQNAFQTVTNFTFTAVDDDAEAPQHSEFTIDGVGATGSTNLLPGAIAIVAVNGSSTNDTANRNTTEEEICFVVLSPFPSNTVIDFTDTGWTEGGNDWHRSTEFHTNTFVSSGDADVGTVFCLPLQDINNSGDQIAAFQYSGTNTFEADSTNVTFVTAINLDAEADGWDPDPVPDNNEHSGLYRGLTNGNTAVSLPFSGTVNVLYTGTLSGTASDLLASIMDSNNWASFSGPTNLDTSSLVFDVTGSGDLQWDVVNLTDAQLFDGGYTVTNTVVDSISGLATNPIPSFEIFNRDGDSIVSNNFTITYTNGATEAVQLIVTASTGRFDEIQIGSLTASVVAVDIDADRPNDSLATPLYLDLLITDDDPVDPVISNLGSPDLSQVAISTLAAGDIAVLGMNGDGDDDFVFITFVQLAGGTEILFTDEGVESGNLAGAAEGVLTWTAPVGGLAVGAVVVVSDPGGSPSADEGGAVESGAYAFGTGGDQIIAYQATTSSTTFLFAVNTDSTAWDNSAPGGSSNSEIPPGLTAGVDALHMNNGSFSFGSDEDNARYTGVRTGTVASMKTELQTAGNWETGDGVGDQSFVFSSTDAILSNSGIQLALTDADLIAGGWGITGLVADAFSGISSTGVTMDVHQSDGSDPAAFVNIVHNETINNGVLSTSLTWTVGAISVADNLLGTYTAVVEAVDADADRTNDVLSATNEFSFLVVDDDDVPPVLATQGTSFNYVTFKGQSAGSSGTALTDEDLATASMVFSSRVYDVDSGFSNATYTLNGPTGTVIYSSISFDTEPPSGHQTNTFTSSNTHLVEDTLDLTGHVVLGIYTMRVTAADADADRTGDSDSTFTDYLMFVEDDDNRGPALSNLLVNGLSAVVLSTGFETYEGWSTQSGSDWTQTVDGVDYVSVDGFVVSLGGRGGAGNYYGMNDVGDILQFPAVDEPGVFTFFARLSSPAATTGSTMVVEQFNGTTWDSLGAITVAPTNYTEFSLPIYSQSTGVTMRVRMVTDDRSIFFDDLNVTRYTAWTNVTELALVWDTSSDVPTDASGVDHYEYMGFNVGPPSGIGVGTNLTVTATNLYMVGVEGVLTSYVFSVDADTDRGSIDQEKGREIPYIRWIDQTAPLRVTNLVAAQGSDPTSEIELTWDAVPDAGERAADGLVLSPWETYVVYYTDQNRDALTTDPFIKVTNGPSSLGIVTTGTGMFSNFVFGTEYHLAMAGRDDAGNESPLSTSVVISLSGFFVTQGVAEVRAVVTNGSHLSWTANTILGEVDRAYDLIYVDALDFETSLSNQWALIDTVTNSFLIDQGQGSGTSPTALDEEMRFYRASLENRWSTNLTARTASEEVYVLRNIKLYAGQNWVSFPGYADDQTASYIFGHSLPSDTSIANATKVSWFERDGTPQSTNTIFLQSSEVTTQWVYSVGGPGGPADNVFIPVEAGCVIELPAGASMDTIQFIGRVPTNTISQSLPPSGAYSLIGFNQPRRMHPSQLLLIEAGFTGGKFPTFSDRIWKLDRASQTVPQTLWYDTDDSLWKFTSSGYPSVPTNYFKPDDAIVIWTRKSSSSLSLTNQILYDLPTKGMSP